MLMRSTGIALLLLIVSASVIDAQTRDSVRSKLKSLKGDANKITITTDEGEVTLEGDEADYLLRQMKRNVRNHFAFVNPGMDALADLDIDIDMDHLRMPKIPHVRVFRHMADEDFFEDEVTKKVTVESKDGKKKVTVKKREDGEETVETYEGEEAEKYLEKLNEEEPVDIHIDDDGKERKETKIIIIK